MKAISKTGYIFILATLIAITAMLFGCGGDETAEVVEDAAVVEQSTDAPVTVADTIELALNKALRMVKYGDKSGLYDNEFAYLKDMMGYAEYLKLGEVRYSEADSVTWVDVLNVDLMSGGEYDSAWIDVMVNFEGPTGAVNSLEDRIIVYRHQGNWIKPTASVILQQMDYDRRIRGADSAAAVEEESWDD